ncbi:MAG: lipoprotein-releasing system ATP-binding protein [Myxococcota bacterium]|jgi:lipoprotein-releasing system ATP-binding protein
MSTTGRQGMHVQIQGLSKSFIKDRVQIDVLSDLDLEVRPGERVSIVGQSGSGKSTFLHVIGTLDRPTSGSVRFNGEDVFARSKRQIDRLRNEQIGFVFQFHHLLPDHDALRNVMMPAIIAGEDLSVARRRATSLLERVGMGARLSHRPGKLSGGEQQRVAIARALMRRPSLLLADEPTGNLDPRTSDAVLEQMLELNEEVGSTLVIVTHSHDLARRFDRRLTLIDGRFVEEDA